MLPRGGQGATRDNLQHHAKLRVGEAMSHPNERIELAMQILECRRKLRQACWDDATAAGIRTEMERLEQALREINE